MARHLRIFLQGLVVTVPIVVTLYIIWAMVRWMDINIRQLLPVVDEIPGMGIIVATIVIYLAGAVANFLLFQNILERAEAMINRVPLVKTLYGSVRDMLQYFGNRGARPAGEAVKVDWTPDAQMIGITTGAVADDGRVAVYFPFSYQIGGYLIYVSSDKLQPAGMSVEGALKLILTGGVGAIPDPEQLSKQEITDPQTDS
ncbi:MAG TPA: DUF502 domain-containing protein [Myxococcales bacterium]|nr:DUF502 domain-containing protein [Myxococcales bacterium]HIN86754.1 DUF502 domain-containing protein [Myxococcales bacterium]